MIRLSSRASRLIEQMQDPDLVLWTWGETKYCVRDASDDGEWFNLNRFPNIGRITIAELVSAGMLDVKPGHYADGVDSRFRLRLAFAEEADDLGDLWVPE